MDFKNFDTVIDARTPAEYALDHIPGAVSAPVLSDAERAEVGTLYKQVSSFEAKKLGGALVAQNVARHVEQLFRGKDKNWRPLVYCWRGGKRSGAMAHILREIGWKAQTLDGGYRAYRRWVVDQLASVPLESDFVVVQGPTGSGKSRLLAALARAGAQVLDLEAPAPPPRSPPGRLSPAPGARCWAACRMRRSRARSGSRASSSPSWRGSTPLVPCSWKASRRRS